MLSQVLAVVLCALVAQPAMAKKPSCSRTYTVQAGDYCDKISASQNTSTYQLAVNNIKSINSGCTNLVPGQVLCLGTSGDDCQTVDVVGASDTCDSIASAAGINTTILTLNNPQINAGCSNIYTGEVLCTAKTALVPPVPSTGSASVPMPSSNTTDTAVSSAASSSAKGNSSDNGDDEDLPYCDEL